MSKRNETINSLKNLLCEAGAKFDFTPKPVTDSGIPFKKFCIGFKITKEIIQDGREKLVYYKQLNQIFDHLLTQLRSLKSEFRNTKLIVRSYKLYHCVDPYTFTDCYVICVRFAFDCPKFINTSFDGLVLEGDSIPYVRP